MGGLNSACSLPVRYHRARPPIRRCTKREIVQTSCLMFGAGETWNAINLKTRELARCSSLHCTVITIAAETSAFDVAPRTSSKLWQLISLRLYLFLSLSVFLSPAPCGYDSSFRIISVREETNNSVVKTRGELIVAAIKRVTIKRGYKSGRDPI